MPRHRSSGCGDRIDNPSHDACSHLLAKSTAIQYAKDGIRANSVHPGAIDTQMLAAGSEQIGDSEAFNRPMGRMGTPEEIAHGVVFLASEDSSHMTGTELIIDGGKLSDQWRLADTPHGAASTGRS